jgi:hypothetical protein
VKIAPNRRRFQDVEYIKKNMKAELNAVLLEAFAVSRNFLSDLTNFIQIGTDYFE